MRIDLEGIALGKAVKFETKTLKHFVLKFRSEPSTFVRILQNLQIETPVKLQSFDEEEGSFYAHEQKIFLDVANQRIIIEEDQRRRHYIVIGSHDVVSIGSESVV